AGRDHGVRERFHAADGDLRAVDPVRARDRLDGVAARRARLGARSRARDGIVYSAYARESGHPVSSRVFGPWVPAFAGTSGQENSFRTFSVCSPSFGTRP